MVSALAKQNYVTEKFLDWIPMCQKQETAILP
jgi:hypothetical protein